MGLTLGPPELRSGGPHYCYMSDPSIPVTSFTPPRQISPIFSAYPDSRQLPIAGNSPGSVCPNAFASTSRNSAHR